MSTASLDLRVAMGLLATAAEKLSDAACALEQEGAVPDLSARAIASTRMASACALEVRSMASEVLADLAGETRPLRSAR